MDLSQDLDFEIEDLDTEIADGEFYEDTDGDLVAEGNPDADDSEEDWDEYEETEEDAESEEPEEKEHDGRREKKAACQHSFDHGCRHTSDTGALYL